MNDMILAPETGTELMLPQGTAIAALFAQPKEIDSFLERIEREARAHVPDLSTVKSRAAIASVAHMVSKSKVALDEAGKALNEEARKAIGVVDAERRKIRERLDALRDEVRAPLTEYEAAEAARIKRLQARIDTAFDPPALPSDSAGLREAIAAAEAVEIEDEEWGELLVAALKAKDAFLIRAKAALRDAEHREAMEAENARLKAEAAEREEADRVRREAERKAANERDLADRLKEHFRQIARGFIDGNPQPLALLEHDLKVRCLADIEHTGPHRESVEAVRQEAIRDLAAMAERIEAANKAQREREKQEAADQAAREAEEREAARARQREEDLQRELAESKRREEAAAQAERDRIEAQRQAEADAKSQREADEAHRARILAAIEAALSGYCDAKYSRPLAAALIEGKIPHVQVNL